MKRWEEVRIMAYFPTFCWSDQWWIEGTQAWFVTAEKNILMQYDMEKETGKVLGKVPCADGFRWNPQCMKYNNEIVCFPDRGKHVWIYSLKTYEWEQIKIRQGENKRKTCQYIFRDGSNIYFASRELGQLYILDMGTKQIAEYDINILHKNNTDIEFKGLSNGIVIGQYIFWAFIETSYFLMMDRYNDECTLRKLELDIQIMRIQADKDDIWIVGLDKSVYVWQPKTNVLERFSNFPTTFGGYMREDDNWAISFKNEKFLKPLFCVPVINEGFVWLIPWYGNEILYIDKETLKVNSFFIEDEEADGSSLKILGCRYLINYVREERYIGIFSSKTGQQIEIDTREKKYKNINILIEKKDLKDFNPIIERNKDMLVALLTEMV